MLLKLSYHTFVRMPRRSPGQSKLKLRPTASDRARRQRTRKMIADNVDSEQLIREKPSTSTDPTTLMPGQSGDDIDNTITTTTKLTVQNYQKDIQLEGFQVEDQPNTFYASENENDDDVQKTSGMKFVR